MIPSSIYSPFGWPTILDGTMSTIRTSSEFDVEVLFTGQRFDWTAKMHLFRIRHYLSSLGRFATPNPLDFLDGPIDYEATFVPKSQDILGLSEVINTSLPPNPYQTLLDWYNQRLNWATRGTRRREQQWRRNMLRLQRLLQETCTHCNHCTSTCDISSCQAQANSIAQQIFSVLERNYRPIWFGLPGDDRYGGYYCYDWAWGFEVAADRVISGTNSCFSIEIQGASVPVVGDVATPVHAWLVIRSNCHQESEIYVDDGFGPTGELVNEDPPIPEGYTGYFYPDYGQCTRHLR